MSRRNLRTAIASLLAATLGLTLLVSPAEADTIVTPPLQIDFQDAASTPAAGYTADSGAAYDANRGYGWVNETTGVPLSIVGNGRARNTLADKRLDTFIHMQLPQGTDGVATNAAWKANVPNGAYAVTIAAGDPSYTDSHNVVRVENIALMDFTPTTAVPQQTVTATITVNDGVLNLDAIGGVNTKLDYLTVTPTTATTPTIVSVDPNNAATNVFRDQNITIRTSNGIGAGTANATAFKILDANNNPVAGFYNVDGAYSNATFQPSALLTANATYQVQVNSNLKDVTGAGYAPFTSTFTTGTAVGTQSANVSFTTSTFDSTTATPGPMAITKGPDGKLYVAYNNGSIFAYSLDANGNKTGAATEITTFKLARTITGLTFDPASTSANLSLYVTNNQYGCDLAALGTACTDFTGKISRLTGTAASNLVATDVITGLPRSVGDHQTNGTAFGPDGSLYIAQGAQNGYGAADSTWGNRAEGQMAAAILKADVRSIATAVNVQTTAPTNYNPNAAGAKVTLYATGIRNPYSLVWASNGKLYAPVNESSNGNTPADPAGGAGALSDLPAFNDYFTQVVQGKFYGHPNPARGEYRLNGANPTAGIDPFEVPQYPVGTTPNANYYTPDLDLGAHRSANGAGEFTSNVFGANLQGQFLVTEYAGGKDVIAVKTDANGKPVSKTVVASGFNNPLPIYVDNATGRVYVGEYGSDPKGEGGKITMLTPNGVTVPPVTPPTNPPVTPGTSYKFNFTAQTGTAVTGYTNDYGQAFDATRGYGWEDQTAGTPLSLVGNGRERGKLTDKRLDSFIHMQLLNNGASGVTTPGKWELTVPNGTYNLTAAVGDSDTANLDSVNVLRAEGTQILNYTPTAAAPNQTVTATTVVSDGKLTIDAIGGTNTKLAYLDLTQQSTTTPPTDPNPPTTPPTTPGATTLKVDFGTQTSTPATGYSNDYGLAYSATTKSGWLNQSTGAPLSIVGNGRQRNVVADKRLDTFIHMQLNADAAGVPTPAKWEADVANGTYDVTVGVGDPSYTDSTNVVRAEGTQVINYKPTTAVPQKTATARVTVADAKLTIDAVGGTNTKIDYVDIVPATGTGTTPTDTTAPAVAIATTGSTNTSGAYLAVASATITATDASGINATTYTVDGGASQVYTGAFQVTGVGTHTIVATATDKAIPANTGTATKTITIAALPGGSTGTLTATSASSYEDSFGLGPRLVFSTVKNEARTGHSITLKNTGTSSTTVSGLTITGTNATEFQLCTGQATSFALAANATKDICVQYRPTRAFSGNTTNLSSATLNVANNSAVTSFPVSLGGLSASDYEGDAEASLQDIATTVGYKINVGQTGAPAAKSVSATSGLVGDEVFAPYFQIADTTKTSQMVPVAHYSGIDYTTSWKMGVFKKGAPTALTSLYGFGTGTANAGYGQNQLLNPTLATGGTLTIPSTIGTFGLGETDGTRSDDFATTNDGNYHNWRVYPAKNTLGAVIPNTYLVGNDIGSPWNNSGKNWDYQDFAFVLTNVKIDTTTANTKEVGQLTKTLDFTGAEGGILNTGFTSYQGASTPANIQVTGTQLKMTTTSDTNTAHTNALQMGINPGTSFAVQSKLVGPFTNINAGEEQQAIYVGPDATHYVKLEVENQGGAQRTITVYMQNGTGAGTVIGQVTNAALIAQISAATSIDLRISVVPNGDNGARTTASYALNNSTTFTNVVANSATVPNAIYTAQSKAGIMQSHQGGGAPFVATYENFIIRRD